MLAPRPEQRADWLTAAFRPVTLAALNDKAALLERRDHKYVLPAPALAALLPALRPHFEVLQIAERRCFTYDSCYFDDAALRSYHDHRQGRRQRLKLRLRRYADSGECYFEMKLKDRRGLTVKQRLPRAPAAYGQPPDADALAQVRAAHAALYGRAFEPAGGELLPVLHMRYRRVTLVAREGGERLTLDSGLQFHAQRADRPGALAIAPGLFILESKSVRGRGLADQLLRQHHHRPVPACSKYCLGLAATGAAARFNRFRPALRALGLLPTTPFPC